MGAGDTLVSGAFLVDDLVGIGNFVKDTLSGTSGGSITAWPDSSGLQVFISVSEGV